MRPQGFIALLLVLVLGGLVAGRIYYAISSQTHDRFSDEADSAAQIDTTKKSQHSHAIVIDAGSSGSRILLYRFPNTESKIRELVVERYLESKAKTLDSSQIRQAIESDPRFNSLPQIEHKESWTKKTEPGLSTFANNIEGIARHLQPLGDFVQSILTDIPRTRYKEIPIYLLATAGMRLVPEESQKQVMAEACRIISTWGFALPDGCGNHIRVASGQEEGVWGWLSANYLSNMFQDFTTKRHTLGFADLGGASTQLVFEPVDEMVKLHANDLTSVDIRLMNGHSRTFQVWVKSWLGYGVNEARRRYVKLLIDKAKKEQPTSKELVIQDPCLPTSLKTNDADHMPAEFAKEYPLPTFIGTGNLSACLTNSAPLLESTGCPEEPCLWAKTHAPIRPEDLRTLRFIGVSEYWYANEDVYDMDGLYWYPDWQKKVRSFCSRSWESILQDYDGGKLPGMKPHKEDPRANERDLGRIQMACFRAAYTGTLLFSGLKVPVDDVWDDVDESQIFRGVEKVGNVEVSWTLGVVVGEVLGKHSMDLDSLIQTTLASLASLTTEYNEYPWRTVVVFLFIVVVAVGFWLVKSRKILGDRYYPIVDLEANRAGTGVIFNVGSFLSPEKQTSSPLTHVDSTHSMRETSSSPLLTREMLTRTGSIPRLRTESSMNGYANGGPKETI